MPEHQNLMKNREKCKKCAEWETKKRISNLVEKRGRCKICAVLIIPKKADKTTFMQNREMCQKHAE